MHEVKHQRYRIDGAQLCAYSCLRERVGVGSCPAQISCLWKYLKYPVDATPQLGTVNTLLVTCTA